MTINILVSPILFYLTEPPKFVKRPRGFYQAMESENVEMPCEVRGETGALEVDWKRMGNYPLLEVSFF